MQWYVMVAFVVRWRRSHFDKHLSEKHFFKQPLMWLPHVVTAWLIFLCLGFVTAFGFANTSDPEYEAYHNVCLLRSTEATQNSPACALPAAFNVDGFRKHWYHAFENSNKYPASVDTEVDVAGNLTAACQAVQAEGLACSDFPDKLINFEEKVCVPSADGVRCIDPDCHFKEYSVGVLLEFALMFSLLVIAQMFVFMFHFDWDMHNEEVVDDLDTQRIQSSRSARKQTLKHSKTLPYQGSHRKRLRYATYVSTRSELHSNWSLQGKISEAKQHQVLTQPPRSAPRRQRHSYLIAEPR